MAKGRWKEPDDTKEEITMAYCANCGKELAPDSVFCEYCGTRADDGAVPESVPPEGAAAAGGQADVPESSLDGQTEVLKAATDSQATQAGGQVEASEFPANAVADDAAAGNAGSDGGAGAGGAAASNGVGTGAGVNAPTAQQFTSGVGGAAPVGTSGSASAPKNKKKVGIIAGIAAVAVVVIVAIVLVGSGMFDRVSTDAAKQAFLDQSDLLTDGAVPSNYVNDSAYELVEFTVDSETDYEATSEEKALLKAWYGTDKFKEVTCSGKIANENFETEFTVVVDMMKVDGSWVSAESSVDVVSTTTTPLKGVDRFSASTSTSTTTSYTTSDFSSTLDQTSSGYRSTATQTVTYEYWFATDTAQMSQTFSFSEDQGWVAVGTGETTNAVTEWSLSGKTFSYSEVDSDDTVTSTLSFKDSEDSSTLCADYTLVYTRSAEPESTYATYSNINLTGEASGSVSHEFGQASFSFQLNDAENEVTLDGKPSSSTTVAGSGTVNSLRISATTNSVYRTWTGLAGRDYTLSLNNETFTETSGA